MALLLQVEGIDVNKGDVSIIIPSHTVSTPQLTPITIGVVCMSSSHSQRNSHYGTPLEAASKKGRTKIVALLLQAEGIDVNKKVVPEHLSPLTLLPLTQSLLCGIFILFPSLVTSFRGVGEWPH